MRMTRCSAVVVALLLALGAGGAHARAPGAAASQLPHLVFGPTPDPVPGDDTLRAKIKACLIAGEMKCMVDNYLLLKDIGRVPAWLVAFQNAFAVANRRAGECERVARRIYEGLQQLGYKAQFIRFNVEGKFEQMGFDEFVNGVFIKNHHVTSNRLHIAIYWEDKVIDAYTGLAGLPLNEYLSRLTTRPESQVVYKVVSEL